MNRLLGQRDAPVGRGRTHFELVTAMRSRRSDSLIVEPRRHRTTTAATPATTDAASPHRHRSPDPMVSIFIWTTPSSSRSTGSFPMGASRRESLSRSHGAPMMTRSVALRRIRRTSNTVTSRASRCCSSSRRAVPCRGLDQVRGARVPVDRTDRVPERLRPRTRVVIASASSPPTHSSAKIVLERVASSLCPRPSSSTRCTLSY